MRVRTRWRHRLTRPLPLALLPLAQQLATTAAAKIYGRVLTACGCAEVLTPDSVLAAPMADLRAAGLSERKACYIQDLAAHFADGRLSDAKIAGEGAAPMPALGAQGSWRVAGQGSRAGMAQPCCGLHRLQVLLARMGDEQPPHPALPLLLRLPHVLHPAACPTPAAMDEATLERELCAIKVRPQPAAALQASSIPLLACAMPAHSVVVVVPLPQGIGVWTCHMHAIFHLGSPDVLPVGDLGVRKGMQMLYGLKVGQGQGAGGCCLQQQGSTADAAERAGSCDRRPRSCRGCGVRAFPNARRPEPALRPTGTAQRGQNAPHRAKMAAVCQPGQLLHVRRLGWGFLVQPDHAAFCGLRGGEAAASPAIPHGPAAVLLHLAASPRAALWCTSVTRLLPFLVPLQVEGAAGGEGGQQQQSEEGQEVMARAGTAGPVTNEWHYPVQRSTPLSFSPALCLCAAKLQAALLL